MQPFVQEKTFTRYIYQLHYSCEAFNEFLHLNTLELYSSLSANKFRLSLRVQIEPVKGFGGTRTRARCYFSQLKGYEREDITGMRGTKAPGIYYGDARYLDFEGNQKKVLILFQFVRAEEQLIVDVFDDFYPASNKERIQVIREHDFLCEKGA